jgi:RNA polymerase sigma-70 factor (ECF subfamily)
MIGGVDRDSSFVTVETVRAEAVWLRRLAAALTSGEAAADDVVQETWLAGVARPPRAPGPIGGWLRAVLRNAVRKTARDDSRRRAREQVASVGTERAVPAVEELAVRLEAQQLLAQMVMRLEEPYRTTVLLRYYEGPAPIEIARRHVVPPGTVRWRLKHALDDLRGQLDHAYERRRPWRALLAPLAADGDRAGLIGKGIIVAKTIKAAVIIAGILLALAVGERAFRHDPATERVKAAAVDGTAAGGPARRTAGNAGRLLGNYRRGARTAVPRFTAAVARDAVPPAFIRPPRLEPMAGPERLRNRFPQEPPNFKDTQRRVHENLTAVHERAQKCLEKYSGDDPSLRPGVMLGISADPTGLQSVWIEDRVDVPEGPLTCFASAIYELDWSGITDRPAEITFRIRYQNPDAGR